MLASSVSMDKVYTKQIVDHTGVRQAAYELVIRKELEKMDEVVARIETGSHIRYLSSRPMQVLPEVSARRRIAKS